MNGKGLYYSLQFYKRKRHFLLNIGIADLFHTIPTPKYMINMQKY
jgi:hypothetical protein